MAKILLVVRTLSGSAYEFSDDNKVRRVEFTHGLRRDGEWLILQQAPIIMMGRPMQLVLEPLGEGEATVRTTSTVTSKMEVV